MPSSTSASVLPLRRVAGYVLERRLGRGATGEVWLGRHAQTGQQAAVKLLAPHSDARVRSCFEVERKAAARLAHPHILPIFEHGDDYLISAYVRGMDLRQRLRAPMTVHEALRIARAIGMALTHAHERGVIHRDVKPSNVLLDEQSFVYLADFGVAGLLDDAHTLRGLRAGTHGYMAPEQARGQAELASDQFGLGRTLYAMLYGEPELGAEPLPQRRDIPRLLQDLLERCVAESASDRFPSMLALIDSLDEAIRDIAPGRHVLELVAPRRATADFGWCRVVKAVVEHGEALCEAQYTLGELHERGALGELSRHAILEQTGLNDLGFSVFGNSAKLGALTDPSALARADEVVVLMHGLFCERRFFRRVALECCRRNASRIVIAPDLYGMGESPYASGAPSSAQAAPRSCVTMLLDLLMRLGLSTIPTVLFAHSYSASGVLEMRDEELPETWQRVVLTPVFPHLMPGYRLMLEMSKLPTYAISKVPRLHRFLTRFLVRKGSHAAGGSLSEELVVRMGDTIASTPPQTMGRFMDSLCTARPAAGALGRCLVVSVPDDPSLPLPMAQKALAALRIPEDRLFLLASGGHFPVGDQADHPEWTSRNIHDLCAVIDEAFDLPSVAASDPTLPQDDLLYESGARRQLPKKR